MIVAVDKYPCNLGPNRFILTYQFKKEKLVDITIGGHDKELFSLMFFGQLAAGKSYAITITHK